VRLRPVLVPALAAAVLGVLAFAGPDAGAMGSARIAQNPVAVASGSYVEVRVDWSGQAARTLMFLSVCNRPSTAPGFEVGLHCSPLTGVTPNGTPDGSGSATVPVFRGPEPGGDLAWGCFAAEDPTPPGIERHETCYVRVTNTVVLNNDDAVDVPFTLTGVGAPPPAGPLGAPVGAPAAPTAPVVAPAVEQAPAEVPLAFAG
jgi:hypothetical protein